MCVCVCVCVCTLRKNNETGHIGLYIYFYPVTHFWNFQKHEKINRNSSDLFDKKKIE